MRLDGSVMKKRVKYCFIDLVLSTVLVFCASLLGSCSLYLDHQENQMRGQFSQHFDIFVELVAMHKQDEKLSVIDPKWTQIDLPARAKSELEGRNVGLSESRWNAYKRLFIQAGVNDGLRRHYTLGQEEPIALLFFRGLGSFGFAYKEKVPARVFKSFQECREITFDDKFRCYVFLRKNWYMYLGANNEPVGL